MFRQHGYTSEAEQILIAHAGMPGQVAWPGARWARRAIDNIYATIGYEYRPWEATEEADAAGQDDREGRRA